MLQSLGWAALGTGFTFLMTTLGAAMVFFFAGEPRPHFQKTLLGFAAGVMTAASVWSLLLPAIDRAAEEALPDWLPAAGGCCWAWSSCPPWMPCCPICGGTGPGRTPPGGRPPC